MKTLDMAQFTGRLAVLVEGGLPLVRSLDVLHQQTREPQVKRIVADLADHVRQGSSFSEALSRQERLFGPLYIGLVQTGEASGDMGPVLHELARLQDLESQTAGRVRQALIYPAALLLMALLVAIFLTLFVIPRFEFLFDELGQTLPLPTRLLIQAAVWARQGLWLLGMAGLGLAWWWRANRTSVRSWSLAKLGSLSAFRSLAQGLFLERWTRVMATLLRSGFNPLDALLTSQKIFKENIFKSEVKKISEMVSQGDSLAQALSGSELFPPDLAELVAVGEETNSLDSVLDRMSQTYQRETEARVKTTLTFLEPVLILIMGAVIAFVALAMLLPIFDMSGSLR